MFIDPTEQQEHDDAKLARMHPDAYEAKMKAMQEYNPIKDFISILKKLSAKIRE